MSFATKIGIGTLNLLSHLPLRVLYVISDVQLYPLVRFVVRYRVKVVRKNMLKAFPDKTEKERRDIERRFYHYFCDLAVEIIKGHSITAEEIKRRVTFKGIDQMSHLYDRHDFVCCYLSHFTNWEWYVGLPFALEPYGAGMCQIYHPLKNKAFDQWFLDNRARFGAVNIPMKQTVRRLLALRNEMGQEGSKVRSYMLGCIADQLPKVENVHHRITFLNQDTAVFTGSEVLGRKFDMAFVYCKLSRPRRGYYVMEFIEMNKPEGESEFPMTDQYMARFERDLLEQPELWLWTHDRWKR